MRISVDVAAGAVTLVDLNVFNSFDLAAEPAESSEADIAAALGSVGSPAGDDHLWISVAEIQRLAGDAATSEWESNFEMMLAYASTQDWTNDDQSMIKAHIHRG